MHYITHAEMEATIAKLKAELLDEFEARADTGSSRPFQRQWHPTTKAAEMLGISAKMLRQRRFKLKLNHHYRPIHGSGKHLEFHVERCREVI